MDSLEEAWARLKVSDDEKEVWDIDEVVQSEGMDSQLALCLVGKLLTENSYNIERLKTAMQSAWKPQKDMFVKELEHMILVFQFACPHDRKKVLDNGPYIYEGSFLLLQELNGDEQPEDITFTKVDIWVEVYNLPLNKRNKECGVWIGSKLGTFLEFDETDLTGLTKTIRVRVLLDISKPLCRGKKIMVRGAVRWIFFRYEGLPDFCYICGCVGHDDYDCETYEDDMPEDEFPYGEWLRASPKKNRGSSAVAEQEAENRLVRQLREAGKAKNRLLFEKEHGGEDEQTGAPGRVGVDPSQTSFSQVLKNLNIPLIKKKNLNIPTKIINPVELIKKDEKVGSSVRLSDQKVLDSGSVLDPAVLDLTDDELLAKFATGVSRVTSLAVGISYPTLAATPNMFINAYKNVLAIAVATDYYFTEAEEVKKYLRETSKFAAAATSGDAAPFKYVWVDDSDADSHDDFYSFRPFD